ncbi:hypothetical protein [Clostridium sp. FS41]|uniref:hypothetical protein n=1 Tax=Clostridia TaxID=186801 RepID=UPI0005D381A4|nr:hypothetical protein [Clostridium sp. FS41]KJJ70240.1 hypothetical protein CLFS41_35870 [Clostridium sp. FS41]
MKKHYLTIAVMALALGMTACSSKTNETTAPTTTQAQTTEAATASAEAEDDLEEDYFYGFVGEVNDKIITVAEGEDKAVKFDITDAEITGADAIGVGDEVEVTFNGEMSQDVTKAKSVEIITSAAEEAEAEAAAENDEIISGTIEKADDKTVTLKTEDGTYTFNALIAQKVTKGGIKAGVNADVTFYGDLEDEEDKPVATKIVTEDAKDTPDAKVNALTGKVAEVKSDYVVLDTVDPENTLFTFLGTEGMFDGVKVGDTATVIYEGTLTDKTIKATGVK